MEIIFLNTYNGRIRGPISEFFSAHAGRTDIFCLQEVYGTSEAYATQDNMKQLATELLPDYQPFFAYKEIEKDDFPQATYVHPRVSVLETEILFPTEQRFGLGIVTEVGSAEKRLVVCNFHGRSRPGSKFDTPERLDQSRALIDRFREVTRPRIIGGDFNLDLNTESIRLFEAAGYRNLIKEMGIRATRNRIAWANYPATPQLYSDFVFVSNDIVVKRFEVPENEISDHLPLILEVD